jgi:hypothetical protein
MLPTSTVTGAKSSEFGGEPLIRPRHLGALSVGICARFDQQVFRWLTSRPCYGPVAKNSVGEIVPAFI